MNELVQLKTANIHVFRLIKSKVLHEFLSVFNGKYSKLKCSRSQLRIYKKKKEKKKKKAFDV